MSVLSKLTETLQFGQPNLHTTCAESFHTWQHDCTKAWMEAVPTSLIFSLRTYATVYLASALLSSKGNVKKIEWKKLIINVTRSATFLTVNLILYFSLLCYIRRAVGFFSVANIGYANGVLSSLLAIFIEKKARRSALALYLTNQASETVFRQLVNHGYLRLIPGGTFIPFSIGLALFKFLDARGSLDKGLKGAISFALQDSPKSPNAVVQGYGRKIAERMPETYQKFIQRLKTECSKTDKCDHDHSCVYNVIKKSTHNFTLGLGVSSALAIMGNLAKIVRSPTNIFQVLLSRNNLRMPIFFGLIPLIFNSLRCLLHRLPFPVSGTLTDVVSALAAGAAMTAFPNISIAMFTMWKAIEALYGDLVNKGYLRWYKNGDALLYAISTGYVLGCLAFEPHAIRSGYVHFLEKLTGNRIKFFNRHHFDYFGAQSSKLYGVPSIDYFPGHEDLKKIF